jgi:hypothetical protein
MRFFGNMIDGGGYSVPQSVQKATASTQNVGTPFGQAGSKAPIKVEVERGDTLSSIAKENNTTVKAILAANPKFTEDPKYKGGNTIFSGTKVIIPPKVSTPAKSSTPIVEVPKPKNEPSKSEPPKNETSVVSPTEETKVVNITSSQSSTTSVVSQSQSEYSQPSVTATPLTPADITTASVAASLPPAPVKTAPIDTVQFNEEGILVEAMIDLIFENVGGQELINIARNDIVNGQNISYNPIKNLSSIQQQYNPNNILSVQLTSDKYFSNFSIKLENKIPIVGNGPNGANVYLDEDTGSMVIEAVNLESDEQIEIEITTSGTIYEAEFGEIVS